MLSSYYLEESRKTRACCKMEGIVRCSVAQTDECGNNIRVWMDLMPNISPPHIPMTR